MRRIAMRDRPYERQMERSYIASLNEAYDDYFSNFSHKSRILTIETDGMNFVGIQQDFDRIAGQIREVLSQPPMQPQLPIAQTED
jgi:deoxyguanosine kinase